MAAVSEHIQYQRGMNVVEESNMSTLRMHRVCYADCTHVDTGLNEQDSARQV